MRSLISFFPPARRGVASTAAAVGLAGLLFAVGACQQATDTPPPAAADQPHAGPPLFEDVTEASGVRIKYGNGEEANHYAILESLGGGVALIDYDGDGLPELYVCQYANWSWKNNPVCGGYTSDIKRDVCPPKQFTAMPHALYQNVPVDPKDPSKGRKFVDVTRSAGIRIDHPAQ